MLENQIRGLAFVFGDRLPRELRTAFIEQARRASEGIPGLSAAMQGLVAARAAVLAAVAAIDADIKKKVVAEAGDRRIPEVARRCRAAPGARLQPLKAQILEFDRRIRVWHRSNQTSKRLDEIPGVGPALTTALAAKYCRSQGVPIPSGLLGRDRAGAEAAFEQGQGPAGQHQQTRRSLSAQPVHDGSARGYPLCQDPWLRAPPLAHGTAGAVANQGCRYRACQQTGLGHDDKGRALQGARRSCGVNDRAGYPA